MFRWKVIDAISGRNRRDPGGFVAPFRAYDRELVQSGQASLLWIGHAAFLITLGGRRVLIDPSFAPRIGPVRRLVRPGISLDELPHIDVVLITHNHRDHMDAWSIERLGDKPLYVVPLGNAPWLRRAGAVRIVELDWWQTTELDPLHISLVPARHWSMRMPWDKNDALWGGFVIQGPEGTAYHSGDTAAFDGFSEIGRRLGPIDWAMLPIGAYEPRWFMQPQHLDPGEAADAAIALGAKNFVAMHWATFPLTDEPLAEPALLARKAWDERGRDPERLWLLDIGETRALSG